MLKYCFLGSVLSFRPQGEVKAWKMDPKDITMPQTGGTAARMAALVGKKVDATVQSYPEIFQARKLGMNVLADMGDFGFYTNTSNIVATGSERRNVRPLWR